MKKIASGKAAGKLLGFGYGLLALSPVAVKRVYRPLALKWLAVDQIVSAVHDHQKLHFMDGWCLSNRAHGSTTVSISAYPEAIQIQYIK